MKLSFIIVSAVSFISRFHPNGTPRTTLDYSIKYKQNQNKHRILSLLFYAHIKIILSQPFGLTPFLDFNFFTLSHCTIKTFFFPANPSAFI